jgi:hypothetical protein
MIFLHRRAVAFRGWVISRIRTRRDIAFSASDS